MLPCPFPTTITITPRAPRGYLVVPLTLCLLFSYYFFVSLSLSLSRSLSPSPEIYIPSHNYVTSICVCACVCVCVRAREYFEWFKTFLLNRLNLKLRNQDLKISNFQSIDNVLHVAIFCGYVCNISKQPFKIIKLVNKNKFFIVFKSCLVASKKLEKVKIPFYL